jgi:hypothetical protein
MLVKSRKEHDLLTGLGASTPASPPSSALETVDVFSEPHPTLPLWRRVDRQFWWNEWLSKPLVDAGVSVEYVTQNQKSNSSYVFL